jgi:hypothetical protein
MKITKETTTVKKVAKKIAKKVVKAVAPAVVKNKDNNLYHITMLINGETLTIEHEDLVKGLNFLCPRVLKTNMTIKIEKDGKMSDNYLLLMKARLIFRSRIGVDIFVNRLILK